MSKHKKSKKNLKTNSTNTLFSNFSNIQFPETTPQKNTLSSTLPLSRFTDSDLISLNESLLTSLYSNCYITQRLIEQPVEDALRGGVVLISEELGDDTKVITSYLEENGVLDTVRQAFIYSRLYGGSCILIDSSNAETHEELKLESITKDTEFSFDCLTRHQIELDEDNADYYKVKFPDLELSIHNSRVIRIQNKEVPPSLASKFKGWGYSECERLKVALNFYNKSSSVFFELIDEAKIDVFLVDQLKEHRDNPEAMKQIMEMINIANYFKSYKNALVMDSRDEFQQKSINLQGIDSATESARSNIVTASGLNRLKILGESSSGFSNDESLTEDYNALVESKVREPMKRVLRQIIRLIMKKLFGVVYNFEISFKSLRILSSLDEEEIKTKKTSRLISLLSAGIIDQKEARDFACRENLI